MLAFRHQMSLGIQSFLAYLNVIWFVPLFILILNFGQKYSIHDLKRFRKKAKEIRKAYPDRPIIIASNHLTLIDSMLITWSLLEIKDYLVHFRLFPWNVPELANFGRNPLLKIMCYLGKCVYVERQGKMASKALTLNKLKFLLSRNQTICIFPEGGRSRTGRIDSTSATYGIGQLIEAFPEAMVWCVYLRGESQQSYSNFPKRGEQFHTALHVIQPSSSATGRRKHRDLTMEVMAELESMEKNYFNHRQRHYRPAEQYTSPSICPEGKLS